MTSRNYCFTAYDGIEADNLRTCMIRKYIIAGLETCPTTGRQHIQGYIELTDSVRISALKKIAPTTHFEKRMGTAEQAIEYCKKEGKWKEEGERSKQGKRTDLEELKESLDSNKSKKEISELHFSSFIKYDRGIDKYRVLHETPRDHVTELHIYWGDPGSGKSRKAHEENKGAYWLMKPNGSSVFFDGYDGHETVIIDDFYGWLPYDLLLRMADRYPLRVQIKGGSVNFVAKKIIITSNHPYAMWYNNPNIVIGALERRITNVQQFCLSNQPNCGPNQKDLSAETVSQTRCGVGNTTTASSHAPINDKKSTNKDD